MFVGSVRPVVVVDGRPKRVVRPVVGVAELLVGERAWRFSMAPDADVLAARQLGARWYEDVIVCEDGCHLDGEAWPSIRAASFAIVRRRWRCEEVSRPAAPPSPLPLTGWLHVARRTGEAFTPAWGDAHSRNHRCVRRHVSSLGKPVKAIKKVDAGLCRSQSGRLLHGGRCRHPMPPLWVRTVQVYRLFYWAPGAHYGER
jgi:hypothetical protein